MHLAAGVAFYALMSLFPMSLILIGLLRYLYSPEEIVSWLVNLFGNQTSMSPDFLRETVEGSTHLRSAAGVLGILGLVLSSTLVFAAVMR
ncbi:MAG: YihY/virulence factor BrkB family protein, partial [Chloroflexi bacterium]|nr:YihY/virulence factor BrkB family protein [Chloroflexota bacterium]